MTRSIMVTLVLILTVNIGRADTYWVEWTGDTFPETEGWTRYSSDPPAERWLEDGSLFIDSRAEWFISEEYFMPRPGMMTLGDEEVFILRWRVKVDEVIVYVDPGVGIMSDDQYTVKFDLAVDRVDSFYEPGMVAFFAPGEFHEFWFESADMRTYELYIDSVLALEGTFFESVFSGAGVGWGDMGSHRSLSEWDNVEFAIVPEPGSAVYAIALWTLRLLRRSATR